MPRPESLWDHPLTLRALVKRLSGMNGPYAGIHDAIVLQEFCEAFDVSPDAVSAQLETYVHASSDAVN